VIDHTKLKATEGMQHFQQLERARRWDRGQLGGGSFPEEAPHWSRRLERAVGWGGCCEQQAGGIMQPPGGRFLGAELSIPVSL